MVKDTPTTTHMRTKEDRTSGMSSAAFGRKIGKASSFSANRGWLHIIPKYSRHRRNERPINKTAASTRGTSFSSFNLAAANNNGLAVGAAAQMKAKGKASGRKLNLRRKVGGGVVGGKYGGEEWGPGVAGFD
jgi:hypothetical protein